jgi:hypothetical protein
MHVVVLYLNAHQMLNNYFIFQNHELTLNTKP